MPITFIINDPTKLKLIKNDLELNGLLSKKKIEKIGQVFKIFTNLEQIGDYPYKYEYHTIEDTVSLPKRYSLYPPMILLSYPLPDYSFVSRFPDITHIAINQPIVNNDLRSPLITPIKGDFCINSTDPVINYYQEPPSTLKSTAFWCSAYQNGIYQYWAPIHTMFSRGNIKEKRRVLDFKNINIVIDLYAGIGYFSFSYLKSAASSLFAWEINPWSIEGFTRGCEKNGWKYVVFRENQDFNIEIYNELKSNGVKAFIFHESNIHAPNRLNQLNLSISHINLGLLPSSKGSWDVVKSISNSAQIHIHENVHINEFDRFKEIVKQSFNGEFLHLEKVKTFAPDVWHIVVDFQLKKNEGDKLLEEK